jgi:hypothetical protein
MAALARDVQIPSFHAPIVAAARRANRGRLQLIAAQMRANCGQLMANAAQMRTMWAIAGNAAYPLEKQDFLWHNSNKNHINGACVYEQNPDMRRPADDT